MQPLIKPPYLLIEIGNAHDGLKAKLHEIINAATAIDYRPAGIKFQILQPDSIALPDYSWYQVYKEICFSTNFWESLIKETSEKIDVWIDVFDSSSVEVFHATFEHVTGLKLQASVLDNIEIFEGLASTGGTGKKLLLNVSGFELTQIAQYLERFSDLQFEEIILQIGFQDYPTAIKDTGLQKIQVIKSCFPQRRICFADHCDATDEFATIVPSLAVTAGCEFIEKHLCVRRHETKYDAYSALQPEQLAIAAQRISKTHAALSGPFVSIAERKYLEKSYQAPVARAALRSGSLIAPEDIKFRRTDRSGLTWPELVQQQRRHQVLARPIDKDSTISADDFRPARIGVIVACRMKSLRLTEKAIAPINGVPSVERCLRNCQMIPFADVVVLATSELEEDARLSEHTLGGEVEFFRGDPTDVIQRYVDCCHLHNIDVIIRVTADCPAVSPEISEILLEEHFRAGADYTAAKDFAVGSASEIYNVEALRRVLEYRGSARYSEYMNWYMANNRDIFKVHFVELPPSLVRDYRLTLDHQEDLDLFDQLYKRLEERSMTPTIDHVFNILDQDPTLPALNNHLTVKYRTDNELIEMLNRETRIIRPELQR